MANLLAFKTPNSGDPNMPCPCVPYIREKLWEFHNSLLKHCSMPSKPEESESETTDKVELESSPSSSIGEKLLQLVWKHKQEELEVVNDKAVDGKIGNAWVSSV